MSDLKDFVIENGVLKKYKGKGGDVVIPDSVTSIGKEAFSFSNYPTIHASTGSYAEKYAKKNKIPFKAI